MGNYKEAFLTNDTFNNIVTKDIIYAEICDIGGMGNSGGVIVYTFSQNELFKYSTNYSKDENLYKKIESKLLEHSDKIIFNPKILKKEIYLKYLYGGAMNHVFLNQDINFEVDNKSFSFKHNNKIHRLNSSVEGIFKNVSKYLKKIIIFI